MQPSSHSYSGSQERRVSDSTASPSRPAGASIDRTPVTSSLSSEPAGTDSTSYAYQQQYGTASASQPIHPASAGANPRYAVAQPLRALPFASQETQGNSVPPTYAGASGPASGPYFGAQQPSHGAPPFRMPSSQQSTRHTYPNQQYRGAPTQFVATPAQAYELSSNQATQSTSGAQYHSIPSTQAGPSTVQIPAASSSSSSTPERYPCQLCPSSFGRQYDRKRHYESHHASPEARPKNVCPGCGKNFGRTDTLKRHIDSQACTGGFRSL
ncbi:hypothetical protein JAAARDRAFT_48633 [Jaapia argillacea MUCL 33604]|uniref:C2H2-type domain-containing protein n=1 Tax=Jaapia argillacea MUCL 33604 TaxID=933084 RepID=A0A067PWX1_9AGAM|nr:hypothetical protein JAAARDRAFT_48633 [Jaapia argillacea MUCL 33604]